jgi:transcriptional pleiotropic repressor
MTLLSKTRQLNRLLQKAAGTSVNFMEMSQVLQETINANVYVISRKGKILGFGMTESLNRDDWEQGIIHDRRFTPEINPWLIHIDDTTSNTDTESPFFPLVMKVNQSISDRYLAIVPIIGAGDRIGTLLISRQNEPFIDDDYILAEYGSTIVGMEILRERAEEHGQETRSKTVVEVAIGSLSYSELEAIEHIFEELSRKEGLLVASKVADRVGITRSVIVNALRKFESAGVIETRSLGMKGTYIKILNDQLIERLAFSRTERV